MGDIAVIFGWTPDAMDPMSVTELAEWRERARVRSGVDDG